VREQSAQHHKFKAITILQYVEQPELRPPKSDADIRKAKDLFREILLAKEGGNKELENQKAMELFDLILQAEADRHRRHSGTILSDLGQS
jgi:hypothetical protein